MNDVLSCERIVGSKTYDVIAIAKYIKGGIDLVGARGKVMNTVLMETATSD